MWHKGQEDSTVLFTTVSPVSSTCLACTECLAISQWWIHRFHVVGTFALGPLWLQHKHLREQLHSEGSLWPCGALALLSKYLVPPGKRPQPWPHLHHQVQWNLQTVHGEDVGTKSTAVGQPQKYTDQCFSYMIALHPSHMWGFQNSQGTGRR